MHKIQKIEHQLYAQDTIRIQMDKCDKLTGSVASLQMDRDTLVQNISTSLSTSTYKSIYAKL